MTEPIASPTTHASPPHAGDAQRGLAIEATGLSKRFGAVHAVRQLSFAVPDRSICGLLGPNGAGKSTTIRMLAGLLVPDEGSLRVAGFPMDRASEEARRHIGYLPESAPAHPELRTSEFLRYRAALCGLHGGAARDAIDRSVAACELAPIYGRLVGALSKGYRQRVGLAAAILGNPRLVILDEPSVGLDPHQLLAFRRLVRSLGRERTVLLSSHILAEIEAVCDRAVLLAEGRLVAAGTLDELRAEGGSSIVVEVKGPRIEETLRALDPTGRIETLADGWVRARLGGVEDRRSELLAAWSAGGIAVRECRLERPSLEDRFVRATRREAVA